MSCRWCNAEENHGVACPRILSVSYDRRGGVRKVTFNPKIKPYTSATNDKPALKEVSS